MRIAVTDASIFIDLIHIDWIGLLPLIGFEVVTTYEVVSELHDWQQATLMEIAETGQLSIHRVPEDEFSAWVAGLKVAKRLSRPDVTMLWLATQFSAIVLTGDRLLRTTAGQMNLDSHGTLWLLDQFVDQGLATPLEAHAKLLLLLEANDRLPQTDCSERLGRWGGLI